VGWEHHKTKLHNITNVLLDDEIMHAWRKLSRRHTLYRRRRRRSVAGAGKSASKPVSDIYDDYFFYAIKIPLHFGFRFREYLRDNHR